MFKYLHTEKMHWFVLFTCRCKTDNALLVLWGLLIFTRYSHRHEKAFQSVRVTAVQDKSAQLEHRALPWILPITVTFSSLILTPDLWQTPPQTSPKPWNSKGQVAAFCLENSGASANYFPHWPKGEVMNSTFKDRNHRQMGFSEVTEPGVWSCATGISHSVKPDNLLTTNRCKSQYLKVQ